MKPDLMHGKNLLNLNVTNSMKTYKILWNDDTLIEVNFDDVAINVCSTMYVSNIVKFYDSQSKYFVKDYFCDQLNWFQYIDKWLQNVYIPKWRKCMTDEEFAKAVHDFINCSCNMFTTSFDGSRFVFSK